MARASVGWVSRFKVEAFRGKIEMVMATMRDEGWGKVFQTKDEFFGLASVHDSTDAVPLVATPPAPEPTIGGVLIFDDALTLYNFLLAQTVAVLSIPCMDIIAPRIWGWSWEDVRRWSVQRKRLLLEFWREKSGFKDDLSDEASEQEVWLSFLPQQDFTKPPPNNLRLSSIWLTSATPLGVRAPNTSLVRWHLGTPPS